MPSYRNRRNDRGSSEGEALNFALPVPEVDTSRFAVAPETDSSPAPVASRVVEAAPVVAQQAPVTAPAVVAAAPAFAAAPVKFELPVSDLAQLAQAAGLEWVASDADKIRAVQEAMAAEPKPVHVPRARPPKVELDEGPLILVETRKDLGDVKLPFENAA